MGWMSKGVVAVVGLAVVGACLAEVDDDAPTTADTSAVAPAGDDLEVEAAVVEADLADDAAARLEEEQQARRAARRKARREQRRAEQAAATAAGTALASLTALEVKGRAPMTGYSRERFGQAWLDADRNGCDTRNDMLRAHLTETVIEANGCVVTSGVRQDPYTGTTIHHVRGHGSLLDVDHVVALGNAWVTGAFGWEIRKRAAFGNDPLNLLPVDSGANRQKGDGDAATWLPPNKTFRCAYVSRQIAVKAKYGLWVTPPERQAMERVLGSCPGEPLVVDTTDAPITVTHDITDPGDPADRPSPEPPAEQRAPQPLMPQHDVHYKNCTEARAAGAAPVHEGDPGYGKHLDRDGDGVGCE